MSRCGRLGSGPCRSRRGYRAERIRIDEQTGARDELERDVGRAGFDYHCAVIPVIAYLTAWHWRCERINGSAAQAVHKVRKTVENDALIFMIMAGEHCIGSPGLKGPLHYRSRTVIQPG